MIATHLLRASAFVVFVLTAVVCTALPSVARADAPVVGTQAPGFYRVMLGDFEVTALSDGTLPLDADKVLTGTTPAQVDKALAQFYLKSPVEASFNAFLVNTGVKLVLVDTGAGSLLGPTLGKLLVNMAAAGYKPEQVDEVYLTHMHIDHVGGLMSGDKLAFPNAIVRADRHEAEFWLSEQNLKMAPEAMKMFFQGAQASLTPYIKAGKFKPFDGDTDLVPGVRAVATHGHTPGHTFYAAENKGQKMMFWGDVVHVAAVQFSNPSVTIQFDVDPKAAAAQRRKAFADAASRGYLVGAAHISFPGIGRLRRDGRGYAWVPVNYLSKP